MKVSVSSGKEVEDLYTAAEPSPAQEPGLESHKQILRFSYNAFSRNVLTHTGTEAFEIPVSLSAVIKSKPPVSFQRNWS